MFPFSRSKILVYTLLGLSALLVGLAETPAQILLHLVLFALLVVFQWRWRTLLLSGEQHRRELRELRQTTSSAARPHYFDQILNALPAGLILSDLQGRILLSNPASYRLLQIEPQAEKRSLLETIRQAEIYAAFRQAVDGGVEQTREIRLKQSGGEKYLWVHAVPLKHEGATIAASLIFFDISTLKQLERSRSDFVANVSHELKTPLTSIRGFTETLLQGALQDPEVSQRFVQKIAHHSSRLEALIEDLLQLSRLEFGRSEAKASAVDVNAILRELQEDFSSSLKEKSLSLQLPGSPLPIVQAEASAVRQIFSNLLGNAVKYTPEGGLIRVSGESLGAQLKISVRDNGSGIPAADLPHIFERFYRVDKARGKDSGGTGLGLAIVKHLVQTQKGTVGVQSELGGGTEFYFTLPL